MRPRSGRLLATFALLIAALLSPGHAVAGDTGSRITGPCEGPRYRALMDASLLSGTAVFRLTWVDMGGTRRWHTFQVPGGTRRWTPLVSLLPGRIMRLSTDQGLALDWEVGAIRSHRVCPV